MNFYRKNKAFEDIYVRDALIWPVYSFMDRLALQSKLYRISACENWILLKLSNVSTAIAEWFS